MNLWVSYKPLLAASINAMWGGSQGTSAKGVSWKFSSECCHFGFQNETSGVL